MATIDAKWILYDDEKLSIVTKEVDGIESNYLTIRDNVILTGVNVEYINLSKLEVRFLSEGVPTEDETRDMTRDFWIQAPDLV